MGKNIVYFVRDLSLSVVPFLLRPKANRSGSSVAFLSASKGSLAIYKILNFAKILKVDIQKSHYFLCDLWSSMYSGPMRCEASELTSQFAVELSRRQKGLALYRDIAACLPADKFDLFIEKIIWQEIHHAIQLLCIARWSRNQPNNEKEHIVLYPASSLLFELKYTGSFRDIQIEYYIEFFDFQRIKKRLKEQISKIRAYLSRNKVLPHEYLHNGLYGIAVHYAEGVDLRKRSDLFWYPKSGIEASRVFIYCDMLNALHRRVSNDVAQKIESLRMNCVCIDERALPAGRRILWVPKLDPESPSHRKKCMKKDCLSLRQKGEDWLWTSSRGFLNEVEYWVRFYKDFNIRLHIDVEEGGYRNVAQHAALQLTGGIKIGKQRSYFYQPFGSLLGHYPNDVFFIWSDDSLRYLSDYRNRISYCIVTGFPNDYLFRENAAKVVPIRISLAARGVRLTVALFDNVFGEGIHFSRQMMVSFYSHFLEWVLEDEEVALIIKPKKPAMLKHLKELSNLWSQAQATGRFIQLEDALCRAPSDASHIADVAIGVGISSAVIEAVIAGCKGIHCDLPRHRFHHFYEWGYEKIIFDDIDKLMTALKRYKKNPALEPELGKWSSHIGKLDPFRDGKGSQRIGTYMRWLLESLDKGTTRDEAMRCANELYKKSWGEDMVIDTRSK